MELVGAELLLGLGQLALKNGQFAVAVLKYGVGAAEQAQLHLLVLCARVNLRGQFFQLHLEFGKVVPARRDALGKPGAPDLRQTGLVLGLFLLRTQVEHRLLGVLHPLVERAARVLLPVEGTGAFLERGAPCVGIAPEGGNAAVEFAQGGAELAVLKTALSEREVAQAEADALVAHGLGRLPLQAANLAGDLCDDIGHPRKILLGQREFAHRLAALALVFGDAGGLLEHDPALLGLRRKDLVDLALRHDRVTGATHAGVHEKFLDVLQAAGLAVEIIFAESVAGDAAHDLDLVEIAAELFLTIGQQQRDLGKLRRLAGVDALEDDILHLAPAEGLRALLAQHPADGVRDVALAATVGADDGRHTGLETEGCVVGEAFKAVEFERL